MENGNQTTVLASIISENPQRHERSSDDIHGTVVLKFNCLIICFLLKMFVGRSE